MVAWLEIGGGLAAIERFGEEAGQCGFSDAARAAKEVGVSDFIKAQSVFEGGDNRFLSHDIAKCLGSILPGDDLVFSFHVVYSQLFAYI